MRGIINITIVVTVLFAMSCNNPTRPQNSNLPGSANITVQIGKVGALAKRADINFAKLCVALSASAETTIFDTIAISGNSSTIISKTYDNLASLKTWTLKAKSLDSKDSTIHAGSTTFTVRPRQTTDVSLALPSNYSMIKANFSPIRDSVTRCELLINGVKVADSSFAKQGLLGSSVQLAYDYLPVAVANRIKMDVYGNMWGIEYLLYTGDTLITAISGIDTTLFVKLQWVGPTSAPRGQATISVVLGSIGTELINGLLPNKGYEDAIRSMRSIPAGWFVDDIDTGVIGDTAYISQPFYMDSTEITQTYFESLMGYNNSFNKGALKPVESVTWYETIIFCNERSKYFGLDTVYSYQTISTTSVAGLKCNWTVTGFRLPTEDEWELAARGGNQRMYPTNDGMISESNANSYCSHTPCASSDVASYPPGSFGLYDMAGNVREYCWDSYSASSGRVNGRTDFRPNFDGGLNVQRGGDFFYYSFLCKSANRGRDKLEVPGQRRLGFRCVLQNE